MATVPESIDIADMRRAASAACVLLKTLGNPDRLLLLCQLTQGEFCVGELETLVGIQQPTLSQQLGVLRDGGWVRTRREGKRICYSIASEEALAVMQVIHGLYCSKRQGKGKNR
jgi:DNA-binding transcriptional ArsR family regulator